MEIENICYHWQIHSYNKDTMVIYNLHMKVFGKITTDLHSLFLKDIMTEEHIPKFTSENINSQGPY